MLITTNRFLAVKTLSCSLRLQNSWKDFILSFKRLANPPLMKMECSTETGKHESLIQLIEGGESSGTSKLMPVLVWSGLVWSDLSS